MTRPEFTPAPWIVSEADATTMPRLERCIVVRDGQDTGFVLAACGSALHPRAQANARLISAAPDMFEALADCIVSLCAANLGHLPSLAKARAALSKAEGTDAS